MCWWFKKKQTIPILTIPHPEEPMNPQSTLMNVDIKAVVKEWYGKWGVPPVYQPFWDSVKITMTDNLYAVIGGVATKVTALTYADTREMSIDPMWVNPGVIAHEMVHISYSFLTLEDIAMFITAYSESKSDSLVKLLESQNQYMKTNTIELHAELYRYLGEKMPDRLKTFYPKLL
jgi:hypothetical protein